MKQNIFDVGDSPWLNLAFDVNGVPTDPTTLTVKVKKPDGTVLSYAIGTGVLKDSDGRFHVVQLIDNVPGEWVWKGTGTGAAAAAQERSFVVRTPRIP